MEEKSIEIGLIREQLNSINALNTVIEQRISAGAVIAEDSLGEQLTFANISAHINTIADRIVDDFRRMQSSPVLVSLMDGGFVFASKLQDALVDRDFLFQYTTMQVGSYAFTSSGTVNIIAAPKIPLGERDVIIVDEVWDTGKTFAEVKKYILEICGAKSVDLAVLVDKDPALLAHTGHFLPRVQPRCLYSCFTVSPDAFLIGMGLDYNGGCRNLRNVLAVAPETLPNSDEQELLSQLKPLNKRLQQLLSLEQQEAQHVVYRQSPLLANSLLRSSSAAVQKESELIYPGPGIN